MEERLTKKLDNVLETLSRLQITVDKLQITVEEQSRKIQEIEAKNEKLEKKLTRLEIAKVKNNIFLKDIPCKADKDGKETFKDTRETVDGILGNLGVLEQINGCYEAVRLPIRKKSNSTKSNIQTPPIHIKFWTYEGKRLFYENLCKKKHKSKCKNVKVLKVSDEIPESLHQQYKELDKMAYDYRKTNIGSKTSIRLNWKDGCFKLWGKKATEANFHTL